MESWIDGVLLVGMFWAAAFVDAFAKMP